MAAIPLTIQTGRSVGTRPSRRLRADDLVPGVVYGYETEPTPVAVDRRELRAVLHTDAGVNALLSLDVEGRTTLAVIRDLQRDPIRNRIVHLDFVAVDPTASIKVDVPIVLIGESEEIGQTDGGTIDQILHTLTVHTVPTSIPTEFTLDVTTMVVGDTFRVSDLVLPEGVTTDVDGDDPVASASIIHVQLEAAEGEDVEGVEGEGADGDAEASAEGDGEGADAQD